LMTHKMMDVLNSTKDRLRALPGATANTIRLKEEQMTNEMTKKTRSRMIRVGMA